MDVTQGEGKRVWEETLRLGMHDYEKFADVVGADLVLYPYDTAAYVLKNSDVILRTESTGRSFLTFSRIVQELRSNKPLREKVSILHANLISEHELKIALEECPGFVQEFTNALVERARGGSEIFFNNEEIATARKLSLLAVSKALQDPHMPIPTLLRAIDGAMKIAGNNEQFFQVIAKDLENRQVSAESRLQVAKYLGLEHVPQTLEEFTNAMHAFSNLFRSRHPDAFYRFLGKNIPVNPSLAMQFLAAEKDSTLLQTALQSVFSENTSAEFAHFYHTMAQQYPSLHTNLAKDIFSKPGSEAYGDALDIILQSAAKSGDIAPLPMRTLLDTAVPKPHFAAFTRQLGELATFNKGFLSNVLASPGGARLPNRIELLVTFIKHNPGQLVNNALLNLWPHFNYQEREKVLQTVLDETQYNHVLESMRDVFSLPEIKDHQQLLQRYLSQFTPKKRNNYWYETAVKAIFNETNAPYLKNTLRQQIEEGSDLNLSAIRFNLFGTSQGNGQPVNPVYLTSEFSVYRKALDITNHGERLRFLREHLGETPNVACRHFSEIGAAQ